MAAISGISRRLAVLRKERASRQVFGVESGRFGHRFAFVRIDSKGVARLEASLGVVLPRGYADILLAVGAGVGPYYGLYTPAAMLKEIAGIASLPEDGIPPAQPSKPFPITSRDLRDFHVRVAGGPEITTSRRLGPAMVASRFAFRDLVTAGEFTGTVWDVCLLRGIRGQFLPARRATGTVELKLSTKLPDLPEPPGFLEWYEAWVERVEADVARCERPGSLGQILSLFEQ